MRILFPPLIFCRLFGIFSLGVWIFIYTYCFAVSLCYIWASLVAQWWRICLQCRRPRIDPWVRKISWKGEWQPTPVFSPGEFHGQRSLVDYSPWVHGGAKIQTRQKRLNMHTRMLYLAIDLFLLLLFLFVIFLYFKSKNSSFFQFWKVSVIITVNIIFSLHFFWNSHQTFVEVSQTLHYKF